ncbi:pyruvate ferredoxin oxidoreductase [uncultured Acetobacterium sp.]|uniref:pyruvate ferredoxin oxidoreductase n=1 Tax=uncultured Acetobacterium sp. TaxID=217139 RepID=UPI0024212315|nr:pyruvate ferredoxin oxidoreductase [uncultured Acetobacterium sp.]MBU4540045.1 pyruvate ferredoxin oxidoreductase [Bacillota bacterium]
MTKAFLSGNDAFAEGIRLARPQVISIYPITPQTTVVERISEMVEDSSLKSELIHVESEHSALSCAIGASAMGARTFTATSSQGLLYMAECLQYASGGRFPIVMMNANRSTALPWNIYGDQRDSLSQLDSGWIQVYVEDAQESLDMALQGYHIAENPLVSTPIMVNLDGFVLTHTYETVEIPSQTDADRFLPPFQTENKMSMDNPKNLAFSVGPDNNMEFKYLQHKAMQDSKRIIEETDAKFAEIFGRGYGGLTQGYRIDDADYILLTLGSITGLCREVVDELRERGEKVGLLKLRFLRPFPDEDLVAALGSAKAIGVLEKDISFGYEGTVYTNVNSVIAKNGLRLETYNFIAGLGGRDISRENIKAMFRHLQSGGQHVNFIGLGVTIDA